MSQGLQLVSLLEQETVFTLQKEDKCRTIVERITDVLRDTLHPKMGAMPRSNPMFTNTSAPTRQVK